MESVEYFSMIASPKTIRDTERGNSTIYFREDVNLSLQKLEKCTSIREK